MDPATQASEAGQRAENLDDFEARYVLGVELHHNPRWHEARSIEANRTVAVKRKRLSEDESGMSSETLREIQILMRLSHENIVKLLDCCVSQDRFYMVYEFFTPRTLKQYMRGLPWEQMDPSDVKSLAVQLARGVEFCHSRGVIHRSLGPTHLLVDEELSLKITNFSSARSFSIPTKPYTRNVMLLWYTAPELLLGSPLYTIPIDMWSVGCILVEMATNTIVFPGDSEIDTLFKIFQTLGTPTSAEWPAINSREELPLFKKKFPEWKHRGWENVRNASAQLGPDGIDLLEKLLTYDPVQRISARCTLQHPYFANVDVPASAA